MTTQGKIIGGVVAGVVVIGGTAYIVHRINKDKEERENKARQQTSAQSATPAIDFLLKQNASLPPELRQIASYSPSQMKTFSDVLERAMRGVGTDDDAVKKVFTRMNHDLDIMLLIEAYGVRDNEDLATWLEDDGATQEVNQILETKGRVTYRF